MLDLRQEILDKSLITDFSYIKNLYEKGDLYLFGEKITEEFFRQFREICRVTNLAYGQDWDIDFNVYDNTKVDILGIIIYFENITIKNTRDSEHTIKNLFVRLRLDQYEDNICFYAVEGCRTTYSFIEYQNNYRHSHLESFTVDVIPYFSKFCIGSGEIKILKNDICYQPFNVDTIMNFLVQINSLVRHESLEGNPHRYMEQLHLKHTSNVHYRLPSYPVIKNFVDRICKEIKTGMIDVNFKFFTGQIHMTEQPFYNSLTKYLLTQDVTTKKVFLTSLHNGKYSIYGEEDSISPITKPSENLHFSFRGKKFSYVVEDLEGVNSSTFDYIVHPTLLKDIILMINNKINEERVRSSIFDRYSNKNNCTTESVSSDTISV